MKKGKEWRTRSCKIGSEWSGICTPRNSGIWLSAFSSILFKLLSKWNIIDLCTHYILLASFPPLHWQSDHLENHRSHWGMTIWGWGFLILHYLSLSLSTASSLSQRDGAVALGPRYPAFAPCQSNISRVRVLRREIFTNLPGYLFANTTLSFVPCWLWICSSSLMRSRWRVIVSSEWFGISAWLSWKFLYCPLISTELHFFCLELCFSLYGRINCF